jgi:hypothetical protein
MIRGQFPQHVYALYALGLLEQPTRQRVDAHIRAQCPACWAGIRGGFEFWYLFAMLPEDPRFQSAAAQLDRGQRAAG